MKLPRAQRPAEIIPWSTRLLFLAYPERLIFQKFWLWGKDSQAFGDKSLSISLYFSLYFFSLCCFYELYQGRFRLGNISLWEELWSAGTECPGQWCSHQTQKCSKNSWRGHFRPWFSGEQRIMELLRLEKTSRICDQFPLVPSPEP